MTDNEYLLRVLKEGGWISQNEILARSVRDRGCGMTVHSRVSDLRKRGHHIDNMLRARPNGRRESFYRIAA